MAILFDDATDAGTLQALQAKTMELAVTAQSTLQKEHSANGQHTNISVQSIRSRTGAVVSVSAGVRWTGGPELVAPPAVIMPPALTATTHNWNPPGLATARVIEIKATGAVTLTGLTVSGPLRSERRLLTLVNQSAFAITLANFNAGSEAHQRFWFGSDYVLAAGTTLDLYYDATPGLQAWRGPQATTGGGGTTGAAFALLFRPQANEPPATAFATLDTRNAHPVLDFDQTTDEEAIFTAVLPAGYAGGGLTVQTWWAFTTATSGNLRVQAAIERIDVSSLDLDADSFAAFQSAGGTAPGTLGQAIAVAMTFTSGAQMDSLVAGELFRLKIRRDADGTSGSDDAAGDAELLLVLLRES